MVSERNEKKRKERKGKERKKKQTLWSWESAEKDKIVTHLENIEAWLVRSFCSLSPECSMAARMREESNKRLLELRGETPDDEEEEEDGEDDDEEALGSTRSQTALRAARRTFSDSVDLVSVEIRVTALIALPTMAADERRAVVALKMRLVTMGKN